MFGIQIINQDRIYLAKSFVFSGGEVQVQLPGLPTVLEHNLTIVARIQNSQTLVELLLACEILNRRYIGPRKRLVIPYFPYARQDRIMQQDEAFSLKVIANVINSLKFDEVTVYDPHSSVTEALVENVKIISQLDIITRQYPGLADFIAKERPTIISPDAGAAKKAYSIAKHFNLPLATGHKVRDVITGEILETSISGSLPEELSGKHCLIVDDICDGGRTFIELAKVLKEKHNAKHITLYVTHGIFSKGYEVFKGLIDRIYTTDTFIPKEYPLPGQTPSFVAHMLYGLENIK